LAGKTYARDIFRDDGFPYKDQIGELLIVMVSFCLFQTRNIFSFLINCSGLKCSILFEGTIWPICAESAVKPQSCSRFGFQWLCGRRNSTIYRYSLKARWRLN